MADRLLHNAGGLLTAAGFLAAFAGGLYGLAASQPTLIVLSVMLLIGYGIVGYLLMNRGETYAQVALPAVAVLVLATLFVLRGEAGDWFGGDYFLYPVLALVLSFASGAILTHLVEQATTRVTWPGNGTGYLNALLHVAAYAPVWNAFLLLELVGRPSTLTRVLTVGASVLVAVACVVGGYAATRRGHPAVTLGGAMVGFLASVYYLFVFMGTAGPREAAFFGQFNALVGLILTGLPIAISAVAWIQLSSEAPPDEEPPVAPSQ